jgi:hypothetical protein
MKEILTARQSPWQEPYAEAVIGWFRRECLNHFVLLNAAHLNEALTLSFRYYHGSRTQLTLDKQCPLPRSSQVPGELSETRKSVLSNHRYERVAA